MRNSSNDRKLPTDPAAAHVEISYYPYRDETAVGVVLVRGVGAKSVRLSVWTGRIDCRRSALVGVGALDVAELLSGKLWYALGQRNHDPLAQGDDSGGAAASAPLEGPQGEDWWQPQLPLSKAP